MLPSPPAPGEPDPMDVSCATAIAELLLVNFQGLPMDLGQLSRALTAEQLAYVHLNYKKTSNFVQTFPRLFQLMDQNKLVKALCDPQKNRDVLQQSRLGEFKIKTPPAKIDIFTLNLTPEVKRAEEKRQQRKREQQRLRRLRQRQRASMAKQFVSSPESDFSEDACYVGRAFDEPLH